MKPKTLVLMLVAVACGLVAAFLAANYQASPSAEGTEDVVVAKIPIPQGAVITNPPEQVMIRKFTKDTVPIGAVSKIDEVKDKQIIRALDPGTPITKREWNMAESIQKNLEKGMRAMTLRVNLESATAGFTLPGSRVDVLCNVQDVRDSRIKFTKIFLQNVLVLAVNHVMAPPQEGPGLVSNPAVLTVAVTPEDAEKVAWVAAQSNVMMVLRKNGDDKVVDTKGAFSPMGKLNMVGPDGADEKSKTVAVVVAKKKIDAPKTIQPEDLDEYFDVQQWPEQYVPKDAIRTKDNLVGKKFAQMVAAGSWFTPDHFVSTAPIGETPKTSDDKLTRTVITVGGQPTQIVTWRNGKRDRIRTEESATGGSEVTPPPPPSDQPSGPGTVTPPPLPGSGSKAPKAGTEAKPEN